MSDIFEQDIDDESENIESLEDNSNYEKNSGSYVFPKNLVKLKLEYSNEGVYAMLPEDAPQGQNNPFTAGAHVIAPTRYGDDLALVLGEADGAAVLGGDGVVEDVHG